MKKSSVRPTLEEIKQEIDRQHNSKRYCHVIQSVLSRLIVVAAAAVLVSMLWLPVLQIKGSSMEPLLREGQIVLSVKTGDIRQGDVIAFYYNNKILVKRVIATAGQYVDIQEDATVFVDGQPLDEPYISEKAYGECNISLPCQVGDEQFFVMGDDRANSLDSRISAIGMIGKEQILGKVLFRVWPPSAIGKVK